MEVVVDGPVAALRYLQRQPAGHGGGRDAVDESAHREALAQAEADSTCALSRRIDAIIDEYELPAHTVGLGVKGCVTWSTTPVRNYRDYKATDFAMAELSWLWGVNRHILTPPGLDEQWLVSLVTTDDDMATPGRRLPRAGPGPARLRGFLRLWRGGASTGRTHISAISDLT